MRILGILYARAWALQAGFTFKWSEVPEPNDNRLWTVWICLDGHRLDWSDDWCFGSSSPADNAANDVAIRLWAEGELAHLFLQSFPIISRDDNCNNRLGETADGRIIWIDD
jgi:hypothetical protein